MNRDRELSLLDLPCYVVSTILSYLDAKCLYHLSKVNQYFKNLLEDEWKLWVRIDVRDPPYTTELMGYINERVSEKTKRISIMGSNCKIQIISIDSLLHSSHAKCLTVLALENQRLDSTLTMNCFPRTLEELSLKATYVENSLRFFKHSFETMSNLRVLILDECIWIQTSSLMSLSKYEKLEILSLNNCSSLEDSIPYLSLVGSFGFKALRVIDVRFTNLGSALLNSVYRSQTILAIYFQNDSVTYKVEQLKHISETLSNPKSNEYVDPNIIDDFTIGDYFTLLYDRNYSESVTDRGLVEYAAIEGMETQVSLPKSTLYKYPYKQCTCQNERMNGNIIHSPEGSNFHEGGKDDEYKGDGGDNDDDSDGDDDDEDKYRQYLYHLQSAADKIDDGMSSCHYPVILRERARSSVCIDSTIFINTGPSNNIDGIVMVDFSNATGSGEPLSNESNNISYGYRDDLIHQLNHRSGIARRSSHNIAEADEFSNVTNSGEPCSNESNNIFYGHTERDDLIHPLNHRSGIARPSSHNTAAADDFSDATNSGEPCSNESNNGHRICVPPRKIDDLIRQLNHRSGIARVSSHNKRKIRRRFFWDNKRAKTECVPQEGNEEDQIGRAGDSSEEETEHQKKDGKEEEMEEGDEENREEEGEKDNSVEEIQFNQDRPLWPIVPHDVSIVHISSGQKKEMKIPLKHLSLNGFKGITDYTLDYLKNLNLELLDLTETRVTKDGIEKYLGYNPNCRIVHQSYCRCRPQNEFRLK